MYGSTAGSLTPIIKHRFFSFLIWQTLQSTLLLFLSKTLLLSSFTRKPFSPIFQSLLYFVSFHFSILIFSVSLFFVSSPHPLPLASPSEIAFSFICPIFVSGGERSLLRRRVRVSFRFVLFVCLCAVAGAVSVILVCWGSDVSNYVDSGSVGALRNLGFKGSVIGLAYGFHYVYKQRWVLRFPIVQRPPFFSYKMGVPSSIGQALRFSAVGCVLSMVLSFFLPIEYKSQGSVGTIIVEQFVFHLGSFVVILRWELSHHLHQVLHTKRFMFAHPKGSAAAAAETNPTEPLLGTIEKSTPNSLLQYLAYLDLCMVCENNVDAWRRAAFFEETGETYRRVITACLLPLEHFSQKLTEGLESSSAEKAMQLSDQLALPTNRFAFLKIHEAFIDAQLCAWCARIVASLTSRSLQEDKFGVAQLSGSNAAVISTLLSNLLAVDTLMGKKSNVQSAHLMGPAGIRWATVNTGRRESTAGAMGKIRGSPLYSKAYTMADIQKTSIYSIVLTFHNEKAGQLEKDWIISGKPSYGTHELLLHKLRLFLDDQAS